MYYQPSTGTTFVHHASIRQAMPWVLFGQSISDTDLVEQGVFPLVVEKPAVEAGQVAEPLTVELVDEAWTQLWTVRAMTPEELAAQAELEEAQRPKRHMTVLAFRNRFTKSEKVRVELAAIDDPAADLAQRERAATVRVGQADLAAATYVDVDRVDTREDVQAFETMGLLDGPGRALAILDDEIQPHERYSV